MQSNLGESEKRFKALKETVQQKAPALPFLTSQDSPTHVSLAKLAKPSAQDACLLCSIARSLWSLLWQPLLALGHNLKAVLCCAVLCCAVLCCAVQFHALQWGGAGHNIW